MLEPNSRYYDTEQATIEVPDGRGGIKPVRYLRRRFIPDTRQQPTLVEHSVLQGERLDLLTARYLSDPTLFWQVCDANTVLRPEELEQSQRRVAIKLTGGPG